MAGLKVLSELKLLLCHYIQAHSSLGGGASSGTPLILVLNGGLSTLLYSRRCKCPLSDSSVCQEQ